MKMIEDAPLLPNRRRMLSALIISPLLLYSYSRGRKNRLPAMAISDSDEFIIINGWVLLSQDIAGYEE